MQWRWRSSRGALQDMSGSRMFNCMVLSVGNGGCEQSAEAFQKQIDTVRDPRIHAHIHTSSTHPPPIHTSTCTKGHQVVRCSVDAQARARQHLWRAGLRKRSRCVSHLLSDRDRGYSFGGMTLVSVFNLRTSTGSKLPVSTTRSSSCHPTWNHRLYQSVVASRTSQPSRSSCNYRSSIVCHSV